MRTPVATNVGLVLGLQREVDEVAIAAADLALVVDGDGRHLEVAEELAVLLDEPERAALRFNRDRDVGVRRGALEGRGEGVEPQARERQRAVERVAHLGRRLIAGGRLALAGALPRGAV